MRRDFTFRMSIIVVLVCVLVLLSNIQQVEASYVNTKHQFSIDAPVGWSTQEDYLGAEVVFIGPFIQETGDNVNILILVQETTLTLIQYVSVNKEALLASQDYHLVSEQARNAGGLSGYELVGTFAQGSCEFKIKQVYTVANKNVYIIQYTAILSNYDLYLLTFEDSVGSFKLLGSPNSDLLIALAVIALVAVVVIAFVILRGRGKKVEVPEPRIEGESGKRARAKTTTAQVPYRSRKK